MAIKLSDIAKSNTSLIFDNSPTLSADLDTAGLDIMNSVGKVTISGLAYPDTDGTAGQVLTTDGAGELTFATVSGGGGPMTLNDLTDVEAPFPVTGDILLFEGNVAKWVSSTTKIGSDAQKLYVDSFDGDDTNNTGSVYKPFKTISRAISEIGDGIGPQSLFPGWIISVAGSPTPYDEDIVIPKWRIISFLSAGVVRVGVPENGTGNVHIPYLNLPQQGILATQFTGTYSSALAIELVKNYSQWTFAGDVIVDTNTDPEYLNTGSQIAYFWGATFNDFKWSGNTQPNEMSLYLKNCFVRDIDFPKLQLSTVEDSEINSINVGTYEYFNNTIVNGNITINVGKTTLWPYRYPKGFCNSDVLGNLTIPAGQEFSVDDMSWNNLFQRNNLINGLSPNDAFDNGLVTILGTSSTINTLSDVDALSPTSGDVLKFDGVKWIATADSANQLLVDGIIYTVPPTVTGKTLSTDAATVIATSAGPGTAITDRSALNPFEGDKLYLEFQVRSADNNVQLGLYNYAVITDFNTDPASTAGYISVNFNDNSLYKDGVNIHTFSQFTLNSTGGTPGVVQFAIDTISSQLWVGFNNVYEGANGEIADPSSLTNATTTLLANNSSFASPYSLNSSVTSPAEFEYAAPDTFFNVKSVPVISGKLDDLDDVILVSPTNNQYLGYNGTAWINKYVSYNELTNKIGMPGLTDVTLTALANNDMLQWNGAEWINIPVPTTVDDLNDLSDVNITNPTNGQILTYDSINTQWINVNNDPVASLEDLTDTNIGTVKDVGQALVWSGTAWVNEDVDYSTLQNKPFIPLAYSQLSDVNMTTVPPTAGSSTVLWNGTAWVPANLPTNSNFTLTGLSDTNDTSVANGYLRWNTDGTNVVYETTISAGSVAGLALVAISGSYNDLTNQPTIPTNNSFSFVGLNDTLDFPTALGFLQWNATGTQIIYSSFISASVVSGLATVATSGNYNDLTNKPTIPTNSDFTLTGLSDTDPSAVANGYLQWDSSGTTVHYVDSIPASDITSLATVATTGSYTDLINQPTNNSYTLVGLSDTATPSVSSAYLQWNTAGTVVEYVTAIPASNVSGLATVAVTGQYTDLIGAPTNNSYSFIGLNDTNDNKIANGYLRWDSTATEINYASTIPASDVTGLATVATTGDYDDLIGAPVVPNNDSFTLTGLSDTADVPINNGYLLWNSTGTSVVYSVSIPSSVVSGFALVATTGSYNDLTHLPVIPTNNSFSFLGLNDTNDTPVNAGYLQWNADGTSIMYDAVIPVSDISGLATVATTGEYSDLLNTPFIPSTLGDLSNVSVATATNQQILRYNGVEWVNSDEVVPSIDTLNGVTLTSPTTDQALVYNGTTWINQFVNYNSVTNKPTIPTNSSFTLKGLSDTSATAVANGYLQWNSAGTTVIYSATIPAASVSGLAAVATTGNYNDLSNKPAYPTTLAELTDVTTVSRQTNQALVWNGTQWVNQFVNYTSLINQPNLNIYAQTANISAIGFTGILNDAVDVVITAPTEGQSLIYTTTGSRWINGNPVATVPTLNSIGDVDTAGVTNGQVLKWNSTSLMWLPADDLTTAGTGVTLGGLDDVSISGAVPQQALVYNGTDWINQNVNYDSLTNKPVIPTTLDSLTNVNTTGQVDKDLLQYNGTEWVAIRATLPVDTNTIFVMKTGNDVTGDGSSLQPYATVKKGVEAAKALLSVLTTEDYVAVAVSPGVYNEVNPIIVDDERISVGGIAAAATIEATVDAPIFVVSSTSADFGSAIGGFTLIGTSNPGSTGVSFDGSGLFTLNRLEIRNCDIGITSTATTPIGMQTVYVSASRTSLCSTGVRTVHSQSAFTLADILLSDSLVTGIQCDGGIIQGVPVEINNINTIATGSGIVVTNGRARLGDSTIWNCAVAGETAGPGNLAITNTGMLNNTIDLKRTSNAGRLLVTDSQFDISKSIFTDFANVEIASSSVLNGIPGFAMVTNGKGVTVNTGRVFASRGTPDIPAYGFANTSAEYPTSTYGLYSTDINNLGLSTDSQARLTIDPVGVVNITGSLTIQDVPLATVATTGEYSDLLNTPFIPSTLGDLSNVSVATATNQQILRYNGVEWVNSDEVVPTLATLSDTTITTPVVDQALVYNGTTWINQFVNYNSVTNKPTIPTNSSFTLKGLSDTSATAVANGYLRWNAGGTSVTYVTTIPTTSITGLATVATSGSYTDLINQPTIPTNSSFTFLGLSDTATPAVNNGYLRWNSTGTQVTYSATIAASDTTGFAVVATSGNYNDLTNKPTIPVNSSFTLKGLSDTTAAAVNNGYLRWNSTGTTVVYETAIAATNVTGLATVATSGNFNDLSNKPTSASYTLLGLSDTNATPVNGGYLQWNAVGTSVVYTPTIPANAITGLADVATNGSYLSLSNTPTIPTNSSFTFLGLSDTATPAVGNGYLRWNSAGTQVTYSTTIAAASITGLATVATAGTLTSLTDTTITTPAQGQVLSYDNATSKWVNSTPASAVTSVFSRTGAVVAASGDYNSTLITNSSAVVGTTVTAALNTLNTGKISTISGGTNGNFTVQATGGTVASSSFNSASFATAAQGTKADTALQSGSNISLLNNNSGYLTNISTQSINALNDVDTSAPAPTNGQALIWNSTASQWKPGNLTPPVTIAASYYADMFQMPNNSDWPVSSFASMGVDSTYQSLVVCAFDDTTNEGVGFMMNTPATATNLQIVINGRAATAASGVNAIFTLYARGIPNNAAVPSWATAVATITVPVSNANFVYNTFNYTLATLGLVAGRTYNFELVRNASNASDTLSGDYNLLEVQLGFS